ncbi:MFS transporter [Micromonospora sp. NBC_01813]|uniref:MFS transporter n=1 Tax=Micromonospora sp. NBC_01813 TaxID=2975988 RepID=UPI002DDC2DBD|nr:MFS transporter [Micromonospora sp. NBC_01813]WSA07161.1 MFS transporter [Micromonospora sp. NBC_01813]
MSTSVSPPSSSSSSPPSLPTNGHVLAGPPGGDAATAPAPASAPASASAPTPVGRLAAALLISKTGLAVAVLVPLQLLLTLRLTAILDGRDAATAFGVVTGVGALVALVLNPILGRVSDRTTIRFGRRRTWILVGSLSAASALAALGLATEVWQVVVLWSLMLGLITFQSAATDGLFADQVAAERHGAVSGVAVLPTLLGPVIGLTLVNAVSAGSAAQWYLIAAVIAVCGLVAVGLTRETTPRTRLARTGLLASLRTLWVDPRRYPAFGWAWLVRFLNFCAISTIVYTSVFLTDRFGLDPERLSATMLRISLLSVLMQAVAGLVTGILSDRFRRQKPFIVGSGVLSAIGIMTVALAPSMTVLYVGIVVQGIGFGAFPAVDFALCVRVLPNRVDAGKDLGIIGLAGTLPSALVPLAAAVLLPIGGYDLFYGAMTVVGLLGVLAVSKVPEMGREVS